MERSYSLVNPTPDESFKIDAASPLWKHTFTIVQPIGGGGFFWHHNLFKNKYKSSRNLVRAQLHTTGLGIIIHSRLNKNEFPKE